MNAKNLKKQYAIECNSFRNALRFIVERAKEPEKKIVECGKDATKEEKNEIKNSKAWNESVKECKEICTVLGISVESLKKKNIEAARVDIVAKYPTKAGEVCVTFAQLPKYVRDYKKGYESLKIVTCATWLDIIIGAAQNSEGVVKNDYIITSFPFVEEGVITENSTGSIVDKDGVIYDAQKEVLKDWDYLASIKNAANKEGRKVSDQYFIDNVK